MIFSHHDGHSHGAFVSICELDSTRRDLDTSKMNPEFSWDSRGKCSQWQNLIMGLVSPFAERDGRKALPEYFPLKPHKSRSMDTALQLIRLVFWG